MKTTLDAVDIVYSILDASHDLKTSLTGGIYKWKRPVSSDKEDIVINSLPINADMVQTCIVNVNVYVPDKVLKINGKSQTQPDSLRLVLLARKASDLLTGEYRSDYGIWITSQTVLSEEEIKQHYVNLSIVFKHHQNT